MKNHIKRRIISLLIAALTLGGALTATAAAPGENRITVLVTGSATPQAFYGNLRDGVTYVSVRTFSAALDATNVLAGGDAVSVFAPGLELTARAGDKYLKANGHYIFVPGECTLEGGEICAPVRILAQAFGARVDWNQPFKTVLVAAGKAPISPIEDSFTKDDLLWMARIIAAEARGESFDGKLAVGNVIMNRVASPYFPDTVYDVIFDRRSGVQFTPTSNGAVFNDPPEECVAAAELALGGANVVGDCLYFAATTRCWAGNNRDYYGAIGGHYFYL
ncbi:MAG: cell wall hydrolase [Oscillospiraceae bacterium]|jgi:N-acetylmuramoyl-L-alanine amidase|nr:cell wall hydrolase [Oscillospiraceae bacterium]